MSKIKTKQVQDNISGKIKHNGETSYYSYKKGEMTKEVDEKLIEIFGERPKREER